MSKNYELQPSVGNRPQKIAEVSPFRDTVSITTATPLSGSGLDVIGLLQILLRRRILIGVCTITVLAGAALVGLVMTPQYVATSRLQLLNQEMGRLSLKDANEGAFGFDFYSTLQTYVTVMQSDTLALQVIKELNLANSREFRYDPWVRTDEVRRQMAAP